MMFDWSYKAQPDTETLSKRRILKYLGSKLLILGIDNDLRVIKGVVDVRVVPGPHGCCGVVFGMYGGKHSCCLFTAVVALANRSP